MRILFGTRGLFPYFYGGACRFSFFLIKHLSKFPCLIDVIHPLDKDHQEKKVFFVGRENVREYYVEAGRNIHTYARNVAAFLAKNTFKYDIAYSDGLTLERLVGKVDFPIILNRHGFHWFQRQRYMDYIKFDPRVALKECSILLLRKLLDRYYINRFDYIISLGGGITDLILSLGVPPGRIITLPNGVDLNYISRDIKMTNKLPRSFLFVGGIQHRKGLQYLLQAFEELDESFRLYVIGDIMKNSIKKSRFERKIKDKENIVFLGKVSDESLIEWYSKVECFIMPSLAEGLPTAILEAMANRLPIIASDVGAINTAVTPTNGFLVPPGCKEALKEAVLRFSSLTPKTKRQMGENSRKIVQDRFRWESIAENFFTQLLCLV